MSALRGVGIPIAAGMSMLAASPALAACTVSTQAVTFGNYDTLAATPLDGAGAVVVACTALTAFDVSLGPGMGTYQSRRMSAGGVAQMRYNLYSNSARTLVWADGLAGGGNISLLGSSSNLTVYGRIPAGQSLPAGTYVDTVVVTVTY